MRTKPIRIDLEVEKVIERAGKFGESHNDVLRRLLRLSERKNEKHLGTSKRYFIFGIPGVRILKYMRDNGWTKTEARKVFSSYEQHVDERTIDCQFQKNRGGPIAKLNAAQIKELNDRR